MFNISQLRKSDLVRPDSDGSLRPIGEFISVTKTNSYHCSVCDYGRSIIEIGFKEGAYGSVFGEEFKYTTIGSIHLCETHLLEMLDGIYTALDEQHEERIS